MIFCFLFQKAIRNTKLKTREEFQPQVLDDLQFPSVPQIGPKAPL